MANYYQSESDGKPYVVYNEKDKVCYEQVGEIDDSETRTVAGNQVTFYKMNIADPDSPSKGYQNVYLNDGTFDIGTAKTSKNDFVLFRYKGCTESASVFGGGEGAIDY